MKIETVQNGWTNVQIETMGNKSTVTALPENSRDKIIGRGLVHRKTRINAAGAVVSVYVRPGESKNG